jgi:hypothetical protein
MLPSNNRENPPVHETSDPAGRRSDVLLDLVPADGNRPYDMFKVIEELVDEGDVLEIHERWARDIICALARMDGQVVGIVANQPGHLAGVLNIQASEKAGASSSSATPSTSRSSPSWTSPASRRASTRSTAASSATAPSCCTRTATPPSRGSR